MLVYALIFLWLFVDASYATPAPAPIVFDGSGLLILHDGSGTAFNPHKDAGRKLLLLERESCCVEAPPNWHGPADEFNFQANEERHLPHDKKHFVLNLRSGAFVSTTSLQNPHFPVTDPRRYVDGDITPVVALSEAQALKCQCKLGDRVLIVEPQTNQKVWAVYGNDAGVQPQGLEYTQISPAAAEALKIMLNPDDKESMTRDIRLELNIYPGSGFGGHFPSGGIPPIKDVS